MTRQGVVCSSGVSGCVELTRCVCDAVDPDGFERKRKKVNAQSFSSYCSALLPSTIETVNDEGWCCLLLSECLMNIFFV